MNIDIETGDTAVFLPLDDILLFAALFMLSAFFSAAETAITTAGRSKLQLMQDEHPFFRSMLEWLTDGVQDALTVCLISNNVVNIAASSLASSIALGFFGPGALIYVVSVMTVLIVIFGEILPKSAAMICPERIILIALPILRPLSFLLLPLAWAMRRFVKMIGIFFNVDLGTQRVFVTRGEIEQVVKIGEESGVLEAAERRMIDGIIDFDETRAHEIMIPRMDMLTLEAGDTLEEAVRIFVEHGHSRIPVYEESLDNIVGILYVKDTLKHLLDADLKRSVMTLARKPIFVPETIRTAELLEAMRRSHVHIAIVVDEYGGVAGLVTMEDILEEIVGEIQDEYDQEVPDVQRMDDGSYTVQGGTSLENLSEVLEYPFESEEAESLGGLVLLLSGGFPEEGDTLTYRDWKIRVEDVEEHRVKVLSMRREGRDDD